MGYFQDFCGVFAQLLGHAYLVRRRVMYFVFIYLFIYLVLFVDNLFFNNKNYISLISKMKGQNFLKSQPTKTIHFDQKHLQYPINIKASNTPKR